MGTGLQTLRVNKRATELFSETGKGLCIFEFKRHRKHIDKVPISNLQRQTDIDA